MMRLLPDASEQLDVGERQDSVLKCAIDTWNAAMVEFPLTIDQRWPESDAESANAFLRSADGSAPISRRR